MPEPIEYEYIHRNKDLTMSAHSLEDMIASYEAELSALRSMNDAGVTLRDDGSQEDDYATLVTTDPAVAERFHFEAEPLGDEDDGGEDLADPPVEVARRFVTIPAGSVPGISDADQAILNQVDEDAWNSLLVVSLRAPQVDAEISLVRDIVTVRLTNWNDGENANLYFVERVPQLDFLEQIEDITDDKPMTFGHEPHRFEIQLEQVGGATYYEFSVSHVLKAEPVATMLLPQDYVLAILAGHWPQQQFIAHKKG